VKISEDSVLRNTSVLKFEEKQEVGCNGKKKKIHDDYFSSNNVKFFLN